MTMRSRKLALGLLAALAPASALARDRPPAPGEDVPVSEQPFAFQVVGPPVGGARPATATPAYLTGARIMAAGDGALVIDPDSGALLRTNQAGQRVGQVAIARNAGLLTHDPIRGVAYVADRDHDRIAVVRTDSMEVIATIATPAEPYGVALTPDRAQLLVATIADRALVAYDVATGAERWRAPLAAEPRGLAVSPDGTRALVAYLTTGTIGQIDLSATHATEQLALVTQAGRGRMMGKRAAMLARRHRLAMPVVAHEGEGEAFARAAFAVTFLGDRQAVAPFQREVPVQTTDQSERVGSYGGGSESPLHHELAMFGFGDGQVTEAAASLPVHQPHALAWDATRDALYVAGLGDDRVFQIKRASQGAATGGLLIPLPSRGGCGPDGLAIGPTGDVLVWCAFTRSVERMTIAVDESQTQTLRVAQGPTLVASAMTTKQHAGYQLFHVADERISQSGNLACASCHPDNRADGLSWRIEKRALQTPLIAGRMVGTHPFKWDGTDPTLRDSLQSTMRRLGGNGLSAAETDQLAAYLEATPAPRTPTRDVAQVARGKAVFDAEGCRSCHDGPAYTDRERHKLTGSLAKSDTPSLIGLAASAPYYHDGSAATLESLLRDRAAVHGMVDTAKLTDAQLKDLTAFLESL